VELGDHWDSSWSFGTKAIAAPYEYPREIEVLEELPKTISGRSGASSCANAAGHARRRMAGRVSSITNAVPPRG
jgi:hypothetical protein